MKQSIGYFDSLLGQRYFHVVAYSNKQYSIQAYWKDCKVLNKNIEVSHQMQDFLIEHGKLVTKTRYHNENGNEDFSVNGDRQPPYQYDLFAIELKKENLLVFGFPFKSIAKLLLEKIFEDNIILKRGHFLKPDLNRLIKQGNKKSEFTSSNFTTHFSGVELILTGETNISSVNLDGDKPLDSNLYRSVFLEKVEKDECLLDKCSLKCETLQDENGEVPKTKSIIHLDLFGNYKLYIHGSGKNIFTIPFLFNFLSKLKCLKETSINPIQRFKDE